MKYIVQIYDNKSGKYYDYENCITLYNAICITKELKKRNIETRIIKKINIMK